MNRRGPTWIAALVALLALALVAQQWLTEPKSATQSLIGRLYRGDCAAAAELLEAPSALALQPDGSLSITAEDGATALVPAASLPFLAGQLAEDEPHSLREALLGEYRAAVTATGDPSAPLTLHLRAAGGRVQIERIERYD